MVEAAGIDPAVFRFIPLLSLKSCKFRFFSNLVEEIIYSRGQTQTFRDISAWATLPRLKEYSLVGFRRRVSSACNKRAATI